MEIQNLPIELQNKVFYFMSHPCADMMNKLYDSEFEIEAWKFKNKKEARIKYFDNWASSYLFFNRKKLMKPTRQRRVFDDSELMIYYSIYSNVYRYI